jgi:hypothetical protein
MKAFHVSNYINDKLNEIDNVVFHDLDNSKLHSTMSISVKLLNISNNGLDERYNSNDKNEEEIQRKLYILQKKKTLLEILQNIDIDANEKLKIIKKYDFLFETKSEYRVNIFKNIKL